MGFRFPKSVPCFLKLARGFFQVKINLSENPGFFLTGPHKGIALTPWEHRPGGKSGPFLGKKEREKDPLWSQKHSETFEVNMK